MRQNESFLIHLSNVFKRFGQNQVLSGFNLKVKKGETLVIIGRSGCGKSVLLKIILGLIKPDRGEVRVFDVDISRLKEKEMNQIRARIGMVFQNSALFDSLSVEENVGFYLFENTALDAQTIKNLVKEKLKLVGLEGVEDLLPSALSGGMKKRVAFARAIITNPEIILYDEPTSGIDPLMASNINALIRKLKDDLSLTSIVVTHDLECAFEVADRVAFLRDGKISQIDSISTLKEPHNEIIKRFLDSE
jgi:phospholipid/cholesterol/gamma-HCH transport system ATP-binding protein